jgi:hypothetical protein
MGKVRCPDCKKLFKLNPHKWGETGPRPSTKIYMLKCPRCQGFRSEYEYVKIAIEEFRNYFEWQKDYFRRADAIALMDSLFVGLRTTRTIATVLMRIID